MRCATFGLVHPAHPTPTFQPRNHVRQSREGAVGDYGQLLELKPSIWLPGQRHQDDELEVTHAGLSLQLRIQGSRQQSEAADQLQPRTTLALAQPSNLVGGRDARVSFANKLTFQLPTE